MLSTKEYYQVVADIIRDTVELFDNPKLFHIGYDEETAGHQGRFQHVIVRRGDVWWRDFLSVVDAVEKNGSRAWSELSEITDQVQTQALRLLPHPRLSVWPCALFPAGELLDWSSAFQVSWAPPCHQGKRGSWSPS